MKRTARQYPQYAREALLELISAKGLCTGRTKHVSRDGFSVLVEQPIAPGNRVRVRMSLVFDEDTFSEPLELPARVVWCTPIGDHYQLGTSFLALSEDNQSYLAMFLRYLQGEGEVDPAASQNRDDGDLFPE